MKVKMYQKIWLSLLIIISWCCAGKEENTGPVSLRSTVTHLLYSKQLKQHYLIDVFLPKAYQAKESEFQFPKYPVIYVLNSRPNAVMAATMRHVAEVSREIIVGIDFADKEGNPIESFLGYTRDLTPTSDNNWMQASTSASGGHAKEFLNFINNEVKPLINDTYNVNKNNQTLVGHSFGGLFGLYVLFNHSNSFDRYVIASPSLWWDDAVTFEFEEKYASQYKNMAKKVFFSVGSKEFVSGPQGMIDNTRKLIEKINSRNYSDLQLKFKIFEGETHESVVGISIHKGIQSVFQ
ncbi:MAG: alpha/beta hydrolase [Alteromonadaceae bacterium]|nr:alpha/beta hydrolase [Alteromonadaceae bacterium]